MDTTPVGDAIGPSSATNRLPLARVLIVDDHPFFLLGLSAILEQEGLVRETVAAASVAEAVSDLQRRPETSLVIPASSSACFMSSAMASTWPPSSLWI